LTTIEAIAAMISERKAKVAVEAPLVVLHRFVIQLETQDVVLPEVEQADGTIAAAHVRV